jgi:hypothetical protein
MKDIWNKYYDRPPFFEGMASIELFGQSSSFRRPISQLNEMISIKNSLSRYFSEAINHLDQSMKLFSNNHARK